MNVGDVRAIAQLVNKFSVLDAACTWCNNGFNFILYFYVLIVLCFECVRIVNKYFIHFNQLESPGSWFINKKVLVFLLAFCRSIDVRCSLFELLFNLFGFVSVYRYGHGMKCIVTFNFIWNSEASECQIHLIFVNNNLIEQQHAFT